MATLSFAGTDRKVFNPISSALANLPNGAGTMIALIKVTTTGATDYGGLLLGAASDWYHTLWHTSGGALSDDDGQVGAIATANATQDTTNWWLYAVDWPASAATETFHWRNQTSLGSWTHSVSNAAIGAPRAGPTTAAGWFHIGYSGDGSAATKLEAVYAVWAGIRFSNTDYGDFRKTSDLYNHALGHPTLLVELNTATPTDIGASPSTYSSGNSTGTALTGADPDNWTFDGVGAVAAPAISASQPLLFTIAPGFSSSGVPLLTGPQPVDLGALVTPVSDSDSGTATDTGTVAATVPGSDTSTGTDTGTVSATVPGADSGAGSDAATVSATVPGSDAATGTETDSTSATGSGSDTGTGTETASTAVTLSSSDSGTGTDAQVSIVSPVAGSDSATGTDTDSTSVTAPGADTGTGSENQVVTATDPGGEAGAGLDSGTVSATVPAADSGTGTDTGSVADITGGPTIVSGSDSGQGTEASAVLDLTPPPDTLPTGGVFEGEEDLSTVDLHLKTGHDSGRGFEAGVVVDLTPRRSPLRVILPKRTPRVELAGRDSAVATDDSVLRAHAAAHEFGRGHEAAMVIDLTAEEEDERMILGLLGIDL